MTRKLAFTAFIALVITYLSVNDRPLTQDRLAPTSKPPRQFIDANTAQQETTSAATVDQALMSSTSAETAITTDPGLAFDTDIPMLISTLDLDAVNTLISAGYVTLALPDGAQTRLQRTSVSTQSGITHIQAEADGYVATVTRRGDNFFATLATRTGSYRIEGGTAGSRIFPHQLIAQRRIQHETDYRHVHNHY